jgi:hypothetical protein
MPDDFTDLANAESKSNKGRKRNSRRAFEADGVTLKDDFSVVIDGERRAVLSKRGNPIMKNSREGMRSMKRMMNQRHIQKDMAEHMENDEQAMAKALGRDIKSHTMTQEKLENDAQVSLTKNIAALDDPIDDVDISEKTKIVTASVPSNAINVTAENEMAKLDELQEVEPDHDRTEADEVKHTTVKAVDADALKLLEAKGAKVHDNDGSLNLSYRVIHMHTVLNIFGSEDVYKKFFNAYVDSKPKDKRSKDEIYAENKQIVENTPQINITNPAFDATSERLDLLHENVELKLLRGRVVGSPDEPVKPKEESPSTSGSFNFGSGQRVGVLIDAAHLGLSVSKLQQLLQNAGKLMGQSVPTPDFNVPEDGDGTTGAGIFGGHVQARTTGEAIGSEQDRGQVLNHTYKSNSLEMSNTHKITKTYPNVPRSRVLRHSMVNPVQFDRQLRFKVVTESDGRSSRRI